MYKDEKKKESNRGAFSIVVPKHSNDNYLHSLERIMHILPTKGWDTFNLVVPKIGEGHKILESHGQSYIPFHYSWYKGNHLGMVIIYILMYVL